MVPHNNTNIILTDLDSIQERDDGTTYVKVLFDTYDNSAYYREACVPLVMNDMNMEQRHSV